MKLSICIPTYNRAALLAECLEVMAEEVRGRCEVVIVDGASSDDTPAVVDRFRERIPDLQYLRRERNCGVDEDILKMVELASGEYCWLFSDDDWMERGSIDALLTALETHPGLAGMSLHSTAYDASMRFPVATVPAAGRNQLNHDHRFTSAEDAFAVLGIHFGFLSCQVIHRETWMAAAAGNIDPFRKSCWLMVFIIGEMLRRRPAWLYLHRSCLRNRTANDSFVQRLGVWKRQLVTHVEFFRVLAALFPRSSRVYRAVENVLIQDRMARTLAKMKSEGIGLTLQARLMMLYTTRYWRHVAYWTRVFPLFFVPSVVFRWLRQAYFARRQSLSAVRS